MSIVSGHGRFFLPMEDSTCAAFHRAARKLDLDPAELLAEVCHARVAQVIRNAKGGRK